MQKLTSNLILRGNHLALEIGPPGKGWVGRGTLTFAFSVSEPFLFKAAFCAFRQCGFLQRKGSLEAIGDKASCALTNCLKVEKDKKSRKQAPQ